MLTLERWSPSRELDRMERRMRRLFETAGFMPVIEPATDIYETDTEFVVELEVPGFDLNELKVEITDHALVVRGAHEHEAEKQEEELLLHERLERQFTRRFELPTESDSEHIRAVCEKGVLTLHVPKVPAASVHTIEITTA